MIPMDVLVFADEPIQVTVSIPPQKYFVERICGNNIKITVMVVPGADPATYEPRVSQMKALTSSKIYFAIGVPFEKVWLNRFKTFNPGLLIIHTDRSIKKLAMKGSRHTLPKGRKDCPGGAEIESTHHHATSLDPHIWLAPNLVSIQATLIAEALIKIDPQNKKNYQDNLASFRIDLGRLDKKLKRIFKGIGKKNQFLVFHPSWGYFAQAYGLEQISLEMEGKEPSLSEFARLIKDIRSMGIKTVFAQPQFSLKAVKIMAREISGQIEIIDPLKQSWLQNIEEVAKKIRLALDDPHLALRFRIGQKIP